MNGATFLPGRANGVTAGLPADRMKALPPLNRRTLHHFTAVVASGAPPDWARSE